MFMIRRAMYRPLCGFLSIVLTRPTHRPEIMQMKCKLECCIEAVIQHSQAEKPSYDLYLSDEENKEAGRQNSDTDTEMDEYKETDIKGMGTKIQQVMELQRKED